jgi:hypothetical protein
MKSIPLRQLLRSPRNVKKLTASGQTVRITDNGKPLWVLCAATEAEKEQPAAKAARDAWIDKELDAMLHDRKTMTAAAQLVIESRPC